MEKNVVILAGNSNRPLAEKISYQLGIKLGEALISSFDDGETRVKIEANVRRKIVFVIQSTSTPANQNLMELLIIIDALKRSSAAEIIAVMPYYGYARQDRKDEGRTPISAKLVADLLTKAGATRIITLDLHCGQIQGFFNIPVDNLFANPIFLPFIEKNYNEEHNLVIVSPDAGGAERARSYAKKLKADYAIIDKRREGPRQTKIYYIRGIVKGKKALIIDDLIANADTVKGGSLALKEEGASLVYGMATHAVLCGEWLTNINNSQLEKIVVTDSILLPPQKIIPKIKILSIAPIIAEAIKQNLEVDGSVSRLFI